MKSTPETKAEVRTYRRTQRNHSFYFATSESLNIDASSSLGAEKEGQVFCNQLHKLGAIPRLAGINPVVA